MSSRVERSDKVAPEDKLGILSVLELTEMEMEEYMNYMSHYADSSLIDSLYSIFGEAKLLQFLDVFAGSTIKVPRRDLTFKNIQYIKVYVYCKQRGFTEESKRAAAKVFGRRIQSIERIINKVKRFGGLDNE